MRAGVVVAVVVLLAVVRVAAADVVIEKVGVQVAKTKKSGDKWDRGLGSEPDPQIDIYVDGEKVHRCAPLDDTFEGECLYGAKQYPEGSVVELRVEDTDLVRNDAIGTARGELHDAVGRQSLAVVGQLDSAWVETRHVEGPGFWGTLAVKLGARGIGAAIGVGIALLLYKLMGAKLLTPGRKNVAPVLARADGSEEKSIRFWRSPILLASAGASITCSLLAVVLRDPRVPLAVACIPYVLGGFAVTAPIVDAHAHEHLGNKRLRLIVAAIAAMFAVPLFGFLCHFATGLGWMAHHLGWTMLIVLLLCLL